MCRAWQLTLLETSRPARLRDTDQYIAFAAEHALQTKHVFLTHLHADFLAGHLELRDRVGARIYLGPRRKRPMRSLLLATVTFSNSGAYA
jgi:glyoxylase-like metal-dependent hydrolase (beta-lactamase superfamily II)